MPLPQPGPPRTKITGGEAGWEGAVDDCGVEESVDEDGVGDGVGLDTERGGGVQQSDGRREVNAVGWRSS